MGGRGASSGIYVWRKRVWLYGQEYENAFTKKQYSNLPSADKSFLNKNKIKIIKSKVGTSATAPLETATDGRIYATVNSINKIKFVSFYDKNGKKVKQVDIDYQSGVVSNIHYHKGYDTGHNGEHIAVSNRTRSFIQRIVDIWG